MAACLRDCRTRSAPVRFNIYQDGRDTLYRVHGTAETWSIGKSVSSGCVRLLNHDIIDLYNRVPTTDANRRYLSARPPAWYAA